MLNFDDLRTRPAVWKALEHLRSVGGKPTRFDHTDHRELEEGADESARRSAVYVECPDEDHNLIYLNEELPEHMAVHELLHPTLRSEGYPDLYFEPSRVRRSSDYQERFKGQVTALLNKFDHLEIYRRMEEVFGLDMAPYRRHVEVELYKLTLPLVREGVLNFSLGKQAQILTILELLKLRPKNGRLLALYRSRSRDTYNVAEGLYQDLKAIGCSTPEDAMQSAHVLTDRIIKIGETLGDDATNDVWRALVWSPSEGH